MGIYIESPFTQLSDKLFSGQATARAGGAAANQFANAADPYSKLRSQAGSHRGVASNLFDALSGQGAASAARMAAPANVALQHAQRNADWLLNAKQAPSANFANAAFGNVAQQGLNDQRFAQGVLGSQLGLVNSLTGNLFGGLQNLGLGNLFG